MTDEPALSPDDARRLALAACGLDPDAAVTRAAGTHETWLGDGWVLRVNRRGDGSLTREATIIARLPPAALHPGVLATGATRGLEWSLLPRVAGTDLGRAWRTLTNAQRERAIYELTTALEAVHATPCDGLPVSFDPPHTLPLDELVELMERVGETCSDEHRRLLRWLERFIRERWDAFDDRDRGLVHGDPHLENVLWDGSRVSALLDFEWSRPSWIHCDLEILLSISDDPR